MIEFGDVDDEWDRIYPKPEQLILYAKMKNVKLNEIWLKYKSGKNSTCLCGIQLGFTNGLKNLMFESQLAAVPVQQYKIDTSETIKTITVSFKANDVIDLDLESKTGKTLLPLAEN